MRGTLRAFSLGLFAAGLIVVITSLFTDNSSSIETIAKEPALDEMIEIMKHEGYRVVTEDEYITLSLAENNEQEEQKKEEEPEKDSSEQKDKDNDKGKEEDSDKNEEEEESIEKYTLHIKDGMPSSEIGDLLEENNIIDDGSKFNKFLTDEGYDVGVQLGKFKVTSDMNFEDIAKAITK